MALFDFIKKILKTEEPLERKDQKLKLEELESKIQSEISSIEENHKLFKEKIAKSISQFTTELEVEVELLKKIDLKERRENEKLKLINLENLKVYISHLEKLVKELTLPENLETKEYSLRISGVLTTFEKNSRQSYEKATILIGKEIEQTKAIIKKFLQCYNNSISENKELFDKTSSLSYIKEILGELNHTAKKEEDAKKIINELEKRIEFSKKERLGKENEISEAKRSAEYKKFLEEKQNIQQGKERLNKEVMLLKQSIDLKSLLKILHTNIKAARLIDEYKINFFSALEKDESLELARLVQETKPDQNIIESLKRTRAEIISLKDSSRSYAPIEIKLKDLEKEISNLEFEAQGFERELEHAKKKIDKVREKHAEIEQNLRVKASSLGWMIE